MIATQGALRPGSICCSQDTVAVAVGIGGEGWCRRRGAQSQISASRERVDADRLRVGDVGRRKDRWAGVDSLTEAIGRRKGVVRD